MFHSTHLHGPSRPDQTWQSSIGISNWSYEPVKPIKGATFGRIHQIIIGPSLSFYYGGRYSRVHSNTLPNIGMSPFCIKLEQPLVKQHFFLVVFNIFQCNYITEINSLYSRGKSEKKKWFWCSWQTSTTSYDVDLLLWNHETHSSLN